MDKFKSRKFLLCLAAFLGSIGTSIASLNTGDTTVAKVGIVCAVISAAIYAACEAWVDAAHCNDDILYEDEETIE